MPYMRWVAASLLRRAKALTASLRLPYFGLLSDEPVADVARGLADVEEAMRRIGAHQTRPFLTFSIMSLSVSPYAKFTDKGLVDTESRQLIRPLLTDS